MLIEERKYNKNSSYNILLGPKIGKVLSQTNSAVIGIGNQLETWIENNCSLKNVLFKKKIDVNENKKIEPDMVYDDGKCVHIFEIKLGIDFDTKKSKAEIANLIKLKNHFLKIKSDVKLYFVSFLADDKNSIKKGLKSCDNLDEVNLLTGKEFSDWIGADYNLFRKTYNKNYKQNLKYLYDNIEKELEKITNETYI